MADWADNKLLDEIDDPLAELEKLVSARTARMSRSGSVPVAEPEPIPAGGAIDPIVAPATVAPIGPMPIAAAPIPAAPDLSGVPLRGALHGDVEPIKPVALPNGETDLKAAELGALLPSLVALKSGWPEEDASAEDEPLPRIIARAQSEAGALDEPEIDLDAEINGAVENALAAATAALAVTGSTKIGGDVPETTVPLEMPDLPAFEGDREAVASEPANMLSDFERELADEVYHIDPPASGGFEDPLAAELAAVVAAEVARAPTPDDFAALAQRASNDNGGRRRGALIAAMIGGVAVVGALGAYSLNSGIGGDGEVIVVRAETTPYKARPAEPGGRAVPNQDNPVYTRVGGTDTVKALATAPTTLVSKSEDVSNVRAVVATNIDGATKDGDRLGIDVSPDARAKAVAPRKVRTLSVGPDGQLGGVAIASKPIERAAPVREPMAVAVAEPSPAQEPIVLEGEPAPGIPVPFQRPLSASASAAQLPVVQASATPVAQPQAASAAVASPIAPVAEPQAAITSEFMVQIASVPSADAARSTYQALAAKHASILGGRGVDYQVAEISGRGTFHRIRIPAATKAEASWICSSYKAAGGSCFVTR